MILLILFWMMCVREEEIFIIDPKFYAEFARNRDTTRNDLICSDLSLEKIIYIKIEDKKDILARVIVHNKKR